MLGDFSRKKNVAGIKPMDVRRSGAAGSMPTAMKRSQAHCIGWLVPSLVFAVSFAVFFPTLQNQFVDWDDNASLLANPDYRGLDWRRLRWMFSTLYMGHYQPLSWLTLALDYTFWGMNPFGYHLTNLIFHSVNALLAYWVALRLLSAALSQLPNITLRTAAGLAALSFAIHPLRVESVAWVTERRDVLSGMFFFLTILSYLTAASVAAGGSYAKWMVLTLAFYLLSLLSKAAGITLPLVLLILDVYPLRRLGGAPGRWFGPTVRRAWRDKVPFVLLAACAAALAIEAQSSATATRSLARHGMGARLAQTFFGLAFYLKKTLLPSGLSPIYEIPAHFDPWAWPYIVSGIVVVVLTAILLRVHKSFPAGLACWIYYVAMLAPVLGLAQSGPQLVADRYSYLSCIGWAVLLGGGWIFAARSFQLRKPLAAVCISGLALLVLGELGALTWTQTQVWRDSETLYNRVLSVTANSKIAHNNLGSILINQGHMAEGMKHYYTALQIDPEYEWTHYNLARLLAAQGKPAEATDRFRRALELNPDFLLAHHYLGVLLTREGKLDEAFEHFRRATEIDSGYIEGYNNMGLILAARGQIEEAIRRYGQALKIKPEFALARVNIGDALMNQGYVDEAIEHYRKALKDEPDLATGQYRLGIALAKRGNLEEAASHLRRAVQLDPRNVQARESLDELLRKRGLGATEKTAPKKESNGVP